MSRTESPSSINMFKQCPRKYFYVYHEKRKSPPNIHMVRGNIAHTVLERFYDFKTPDIPKSSCAPVLQDYMFTLLSEEWKNYDERLKEVNCTPAMSKTYFEETLIMLLKWLESFINVLKAAPEQSLADAFKALTPIVREKKFQSAAHKVLGIVDAVRKQGNEILVIDYKTSKDAYISDEYRLQAAIYALLYIENHGHPPTKIEFHFLKHDVVDVVVTPELVDFARNEIAKVHSSTTSTLMEDYPKNITKLCTYCDFFNLCFQNKESYSAALEIKRGKVPIGIKD